MLTKKKTTIALVEDHALVRQSMRDFLIAAGYDIVDEIHQQAHIYSAIVKSQPAVVLMDYQLSDGTTLASAEQIKKRLPSTKVIMVTGISSATTLQHMVQSKIDGLFLKEGSGDELLEAIACVIDGDRHISPLVQPYLEELTIQLTPRELQVLNMIVLGLSRKEIANSLSLSPETIKSHRKNLMRKLQVNNTASLLSRSHDLKLLDL